MEQAVGYIYLIRIKNNVYKFGITKDTVRRFREHQASLNYKEVINVWMVPNKLFARHVESAFKIYLKEQNILVNYLDNNYHYQTEIFLCDDIRMITDVIYELISSKIVNAVPEQELSSEKHHTFKCERCEKQFRDNHNLVQHMARRTPCEKKEVVKSYVCKYCEGGFTTKGNLDRHLKTCSEATKTQTITIPLLEYQQMVNNQNELIKEVRDLRKIVDEFRAKK